MSQPITVVDRKINYLQRYDIAGGKKWSDSVHFPVNDTVLNDNFPVLLGKLPAADFRDFHGFVLRYNPIGRTKPYLALG